MGGLILHVVNHFILGSALRTHPSGFFNDLVGFPLAVIANGATVVSGCGNLVLQEGVQEHELVRSNWRQVV